MKRVVVFYDSSFPAPGIVLAREAMETPGDEYIVADADSLGAALENEHTDCFVSMHGPWFPKDAWTHIHRYLLRGGNLLTMGGLPFCHPVTKGPDGWVIEPEQMSYLRQLRIHDAARVDGQNITTLHHNQDVPLLSGDERLFAPEDTCGLILHATTTSDFPGQIGSAGTMDVRVLPLLTGLSAQGRPVAAPVVLLEHLRGEYTGSRWMLVNQALDERFWQLGGQDALHRWVEFCAAGVMALDIRPNYPMYEVGEQPTLTVCLEGLSRSSAQSRVWTLTFNLDVQSDIDCERVWTHSTDCLVHDGITTEIIAIPVSVRPGFYQLVCEATAASGESRIFRQGFWGMDRALLAKGTPLTAGRDYFQRAGRSVPIVGMTYMASDVARKFLWLPNVATWDADMVALKAHGVNMVRTGIWSGWRNMMFEDGHVSEEVLRAIDAFILTATRHDLEVVFTFFSFTPERWGGRHPYLDARNVSAQKRFIGAIVNRHRHSTHVHWDLINEPSVGDPDRVFQGPRAVGDEVERTTWHHWLSVRHGAISALQTRWNMTPTELDDWSQAALPEPIDINFSTRDMQRAKRGQRWLDFCLFTTDVLNQWATEMRKTIRAAHPDALVTIGQDEALAGQRPSPHFYAQVVDYTTVHTWWQNDHLVWSGLFTKTPNKPNLTQETGVMYLERADGRAKRSEDDLMRLLERKYAYAWGTGSAGTVQWIWNTNVYMDNINEANIGALRVDGTEKPEATVTYNFGRFIAAISSLFHDRHLEDVAVVFPYSNDFSHRSLAFDATTIAVRVLAYDLHTPCRTFGEYHLAGLAEHPPRVLIVPSVHNLCDEARSRLLDYAHAGGTLVWTGPLQLDAYWRESHATGALAGNFGLRMLCREELLEMHGEMYPVSFPQSVIERAEAGLDHDAGGNTAVRTIELGKGVILWCPLPLELASSDEVLCAFYQAALQKAGVASDLEWVKDPGRAVFGRRLSFPAGSLYVFVSEAAYEVDVAVRDPGTDRLYAFRLERERAALFATNAAGDVLAVYRPEEVSIDVSTKHA